MEDTWRSWEPFAARLHPTWQLYALNAPWRSGNPYDWRTGSTAGQWLARALREVAGSVDVLIGHSMGANAVLELLAATDRPALGVAALLAPFYCGRTTPVGWKLFDEARQHFGRLIADGMRLRLGPRMAAIEPDVREVMLAKMIDRIGPLGFIAWFDHFTASARLPLETVTVPTVVLASSEDPCLSGGRAEALAADMPGATLRLDDTYDHFCHVQQAAAVAAQTVRFAHARLGVRGRPRQARRSAAA
jgi:pimeloyl-ACP methyl ester carboxylesterase